MDLAKILNVRTLNDYIAATESIANKCTNLKAQLNMSTVLNLKKVRSLEIEYFKKCEENGAAFVVFDCLLKHPPSKTWGLLGKELVSMLQYWLDAVRRHLINHSHHWWTFLRALMRFIKEIKTKDPSLLSVLVELTTEGLLDLAGHPRPDELQRQQILKTLNEFCAESSRELRNRVRDRLNGYFVKLAAALAASGHAPTQLGALETLLRWLVARADARARRAAAAAWFPPALFAADTVRLFLERSWRDFYRDARDFLNSHNAHRDDCVTSVVCRELSVGGVTVFNGPESRETWLDVNAATKTITIILTSEVLESVAASNKSYETLTLAEDNVRSVQLCRTLTETTLAVATAAPLPLAGGGARALLARVASARLRRLDVALRAAFADKYQLLVNLDATESSLSSDTIEPIHHGVKKFSSSEEERRSVVPPRRRNRSGYIVRLQNQLQINSPSTASTTSLAQLHDKLAALPHIVYNKEAVKVSIQPELSIVREVSECDDRSSISLSHANRPLHAGVCQRQSESELNTPTKKRNLDATIHKPSCLMLAATLGTANESVINDTYEQIYGNNQDADLLDLLVKEAFQNEQDKDSGILADKKTQDTEFIENTPIEKQISRKGVSRIQGKSRTKCTVVSNSTTDESSTEFTNEAPCYVSDRKNRAATKDNRAIDEESKLLDAEAVNAFFSQHILENAAGQLVISPTLAKRINETSSETSEVILDECADLDNNSPTIEVEIIDCLNEIVDEVARDFEKCTEMLGKDMDIIEMALDADTDQNKNEKVFNISKENENTTANITPKPVTLRLQSSKKRAPKRSKQNTKQKKAGGNTAAEDMTEDGVFIENADTNSPVNKSTTPLLRKKRKLYSPKDDDSDPMEEIPLAKLEARKSNVNKTPISTCYKELEIARQTRSRIPRKIRASTVPITSPKTKKLNDIFDKLKEKVDNEEKITQVNTKSKNKDLSMYNFSSDSEDEDFKMKKNEVRNRVNSKNTEPTATKRRRVVNRAKYAAGNYNSSTDDNSKKVKKRRIVKPKKSRSRKVKEDRSIDLIDERIRAAAPETLEISFVKDTSSKNNGHDEPELVIEHAHVMEPIPNDIYDATTEIIVVEDRGHKKKRAEILQIKKEKRINKKTNKATEIIAAKKEKVLNKKATVKELSRHKDSKPGSPLPGLVVETEKTRHDDITASIEATMLQKFNKIYKDGPDVDESDGTQNLLLRAEKYNSPPRRNAVAEIDVFDGLDTVKNIPIKKPEGTDSTATNQNQNLPDQERNNVETIHTIVLSDPPSERSIATDGKSPITGHNDLDESPPNMESLKERIEDRDLEIQDMNQSMAEFFLQLRTGLQNETPRASTEKNQSSPVLPTMLSSRERAMPSKSNTASTPKTSPCSVRLERLEINVSPSKSGGSRTPEVVLERMSSDELNKWLPMPMPRRNDKAQEKPKRYNTRMASKKSAKNSPMKKEKNNAKASISPIRLSFDFDIDCDKLSGSLRKDNMKTYHSVCKTSKQLHREASKNVDEETVKNFSQKSQEMEIVEQDHIQNSSVNVSSAEEKTSRGKNIKDKSAADEVKPQYVHSSDGNKSIASVNEWFKRNIITSSPSKGDTDVGKEILEKVMETLETTLEEIQQETGKNLTSMLVNNQKCLIGFREESARLDEQVVAEIITMAKEKWAERDRRLKEMMEEFENGQKKRAFEVAHAVRARTSLMVRLLREDLQATLEFNRKHNK